MNKNNKNNSNRVSVAGESGNFQNLVRKPSSSGMMCKSTSGTAEFLCQKPTSSMFKNGNWDILHRKDARGGWGHKQSQI
jgi:hypothetical protein